MLTNLVVNGIQAMPDGGRLDASASAGATPCRRADLGGDAADFAAVTVEDEGAGIAPEHLPHIFEPFFTTKDVGEGTGLGLSVALRHRRASTAAGSTSRASPGAAAASPCYLPPARTSRATEACA